MDAATAGKRDFDHLREHSIGLPGVLVAAKTGGSADPCPEALKAAERISVEDETFAPAGAEPLPAD